MSRSPGRRRSPLRTAGDLGRARFLPSRDLLPVCAGRV